MKQSLDHYSNASITLMNALKTGDFKEFENLLSDDAQTIIYGLNTLNGKSASVEYWQDWRKRYVETERIKDFEVVYSHYYSHDCLRMEMMIVMFQIKDALIKKILFASYFLKNPHADGYLTNPPLSYERIKQYLTPLDEAEENRDDVTVITNRIPCLHCGLDSRDLKWYQTRWEGNSFRDQDCGHVSVCPMCGRVIEYSWVKSYWSGDKELPPFGHSNYSTQVNALSVFGEKMYSKKRIDGLRKCVLNRSVKKYEVFLQHVLTDLEIENGGSFEITLPNGGGIGDVTHISVVDSEGNKSNTIVEHLIVKPTKMGVWQLYLLENIHTVLPVFWHGGYVRRSFVFKEADIDRIVPLRYYDLSEFVEQNLILPSVQIIEKTEQDFKATVNCCYWNDWKGFVRDRVTYTIRNSRVVETVDQPTILFEYDCGIMF